MLLMLTATRFMERRGDQNRSTVQDVIGFMKLSSRRMVASKTF